MPRIAQRGFLAGAWAYVIAAIAILTMIVGIIWWADQNIATSAGVKKGKAELQPIVDAAHKEIEAQNVAVAALRAEATRKAAEGARALAAASGRAKVWEDNAARLRAVLTSQKPDAPTDCKAAWQEIRKP